MLLKSVIIYYICVKLFDIIYEINLTQYRIVHKVSYYILNTKIVFAMNNFFVRLTNSISFQSHNLTSTFVHDLFFVSLIEFKFK